MLVISGILFSKIDNSGRDPGNIILTDQLMFKLTVFFQIRLILKANNASRTLDENANLEEQRMENKISTNEGLSALFHSRCRLMRHKTSGISIRRIAYI